MDWPTEFVKRTFYRAAFLTSDGIPNENVIDPIRSHERPIRAPCDCLRIAAASVVRKNTRWFSCDRVPNLGSPLGIRRSSKPGPVRAPHDRVDSPWRNGNGQ